MPECVFISSVSIHMSASMTNEMCQRWFLPLETKPKTLASGPRFLGLACVDALELLFLL